MLNQLAKKIHENSKNHGFYDEPKNTGEMIALMHSELSEALEADREGKYSTGLVSAHVKAKMRFNALREHKHGKKY